MSLSAWRAWVEILDSVAYKLNPKVALRMESVGRNLVPDVIDKINGVALRMESVGRNC